MRKNSLVLGGLAAIIATSLAVKNAKAEGLTQTNDYSPSLWDVNTPFYLQDHDGPTKTQKASRINLEADLTNSINTIFLYSAGNTDTDETPLWELNWDTFGFCPVKPVMLRNNGGTAFEVDSVKKLGRDVLTFAGRTNVVFNRDIYETVLKAASGSYSNFTLDLDLITDQANGTNPVVFLVEYAPGKYYANRVWAQEEPDTDGDGMHDIYEKNWTENPTNWNPEADYDGDGKNNLEEYREGTDPINSNSWFDVSEISRNPTNNHITIKWKGEDENYWGTSLKYDIEKSTNSPAGPWIPIGSNLTVRSVTDTNGLGKVGFYRARVKKSAD